jgi:hypothetical protein
VDSVYWYILPSVNESYFTFEDPAHTNGVSNVTPGTLFAGTNVFKGLEKRDGGKTLHIEVNKSLLRSCFLIYCFSFFSKTISLMKDILTK